MHWIKVREAEESAKDYLANEWPSARIQSQAFLTLLSELLPGCYNIFRKGPVWGSLFQMLSKWVFAVL